MVFRFRCTRRLDATRLSGRINVKKPGIETLSGIDDYTAMAKNGYSLIDQAYPLVFRMNSVKLTHRTIAVCRKTYHCGATLP